METNIKTAWIKMLIFIKLHMKKMKQSFMQGVKAKKKLTDQSII